MSTIGFPDWGLSYRYPINPSQCVVFSTDKQDGTAGTQAIYTLAAGEVVVVAAMSVGVNASIAADLVLTSAIKCTAGLNGAGALTQLIGVKQVARTISLGAANQYGATDTALDAAIAIAGGAAGNTVEWAWNLAGTTDAVAFANVILYKTS